MNRLPAVGFLMIGGAFVDQGTATVRPGGARSADLLPLALAAAGALSSRKWPVPGPCQGAFRCQASLGEDASARCTLLNALAWARGKENIIPVRRASPSLYSAHGSSLSHVPPPLLSLSQQYG
jgi:hypothetical protein